MNCHELPRTTAALSTVSGLNFSTVLEGGEPSSATGSDLARLDAAYHVDSDRKDQSPGIRKQPFATLGGALDIDEETTRTIFETCTKYYSGGAPIIFLNH